MTKGLTVTQEGVGIDQALDSQKILDSRWRYFEIAFERKIKVGDLPATGVTNIFTHNLGFLPAFDCYNNRRDEYVDSDTVGGIRSDETKIYFQGQDASNTDHSNSELMLRIYNLPIIEEYSAPISKTLPSKSSGVSGTGIKITSKPGDFRNPELSKYSLNTASKALAIQKTGTVLANSGTNNQAIITHNIGYPPTFIMIEISPTFSWVPGINPTFISALATANGETITFSGAQAALGGTFAYIIFKELGDFAL